ncbi:MAG: hypothetical protein IT245_07845 [Bacteroidia bacterium]|nr:hypothetical protein [Bacteroidia bacterium]
MNKNQNLLMAVIAILILSSCGSLSVTKMRYNRGLNIDWFGGKDKPATSVAKKDKVKKSKVEVAINNESESELEVPAISEVSTVPQNPVYSDEQVQSTPVAKPSTVKPNSRKLDSKSETDYKKPSKRKLNKVKDALTSLSHKQSTNDSSDSDMNLIILIILALIPPLQLLAIYLYFDEINIHFWISLLLLLFAGWFFAGGALGYFGIAIVHALLVVLGVFG